MTNLLRRNPDNRGIATSGRNPTWDTFRMMDALLGWDALREGATVPHRGNFSPPLDVKELKDAYLVKADLPGLTESDIDVTVLGNALTISGKRDPEQESEAEACYAIERRYGAFSRTLSLTDAANLDELTANLENGVLTLHIPKRPELQPRRINFGKGDAGA